MTTKGRRAMNAHGPVIKPEEVHAVQIRMEDFELWVASARHSMFQGDYAEAKAALLGSIKAVAKLQKWMDDHV